MRRLCGDCKKSEKCNIKKSLMNYAVKAKIEFMMTDCEKHSRASTPILVVVARIIKRDVQTTIWFIRKTSAMFCIAFSAMLFNLGIFLEGKEE